MDELRPFNRANVHAADSIQFIIAHESIHILQLHAGTVRGAGSTLLERSFTERSADFVAELVSGGTINRHVYAWALPREAEGWRDFRAQMNGTDVSRWLYNQGGANGDRPGDLGYFVGYQIAKTYYDAQGDKAAAIKAIVETRDAKAFLARSGYDPR